MLRTEFVEDALRPARLAFLPRDDGVLEAARFREEENLLLRRVWRGEDGAKHRPVMLHRAILGALERFIGIMLENYAGKLPLWLAPVQCVVATITSEADDYGRKVYEDLLKQGIRAELDIRNEKINYKVREHSVKKVPVMFVVGKREAEEQTVAIRRLGSQDQTVVKYVQGVADLKNESQPPY